MSTARSKKAPGVLEAQCATRQGQGPGTRLIYGLRYQSAAGVGGQPTPIFTPARRPPQGYQDLSGTRTICSAFCASTRTTTTSTGRTAPCTPPRR